MKDSAPMIPKLIRKIDSAFTRVDIATRATVETIGLIVGLGAPILFVLFLIYCALTPAK
jgi:hypothetical protein